MPELPEVETVRRVLLTQIKDLTITNVEIRYPNIIEDDINLFKCNVIDKKIIDISRLGKFLIFNLNEGNIISHLRMEGKYFYLPRKEVTDKHIHVIFYLSNDYMLCYQDVRKFGRMTYRLNDNLYNTAPLANVGDDLILVKNIDSLKIYNMLQKKRIAIKTSLLEQDILAGLGNIYVDEVLYSANINPHRLSNTITLDEINKIINESKRILSLAIEMKGTTIRSYTSSLGVKGNYQNYLLIHTKNECPHCKSILNRDKINGRTTYYCTFCQR
ncbi:MAG: DNA-formamidopyrimidine glycosylase [Anaeroplasma sp.]